MTRASPATNTAPPTSPATDKPATTVKPGPADEDNDWDRGGQHYGTEGIYGPGAAGGDVPPPQDADDALRSAEAAGPVPTHPRRKRDKTRLPSEPPGDKHSSAGS